MYSFSDKVIQVMASEGITSLELHSMLIRAAITSVRGFNRRFHQWLFSLNNSTVEDMQCVDMVQTGHGSERMQEDCESCSGAGCKECGWVGQILRNF